MIPTKASKLPTNTPKFSKSDSLPVLKIRTQPEEILIPSVQLERKSSLNDKSIDDSISYESKPSRSSSPNKKQLKGSAHSLSHPVKLANKNEIQVEVSAPKELPYTKLDILEAYLPRALRTEHSAAKKRLRLQNESDQNTLYNILKGEQAAAQLASSSLSIDSYRPTHYASGNWSSSNSINTMTDSIAPTPDRNYQVQFSIADEEFCKYAQGRGKLWESNALNGMQAREVIKKQVEDAETLARSEEIQNVINQQKELIQNKTIQKVKALNNILTTKIKLQEALEASESQLTHLPHIRQKKAKGVSDYAIQNEAFHVDFRNPNRKPDQDFDFEAYERSQMPAFRQRVISVTNNGEVGEEASYHSQNLQSNMSVSMQSENESLSSDVLKTLQDLGASEIKAKLKDLANYINSHTSRKILDCWYLIEGRFKSSTHSKNVIETDSNGLAHPVKHPAITLSALAYMLCSTKIKVGHEELQKMCSRWDFISPAHLFQARQIAAMQVVLAMHDEVKSEHYDEFKQELWQLSKGGEPLVSLQEFTDIIFDPNPEEREQQFAILKASRQDQVQAMMDEKRSKAAMKAKAAARKKQMIDDFAVALASLQLMKGVLTPNKVEEFVDMIEKSKVYIGKQKEDQAANVPQDLVLFLGLEAYPKIIQEKINAKREAREANRRNRPSDASSMSIDSSLNPFTKANIAARKGLPSNLSKPAEQSDDISVISQQSSQVALSARGESTNQTRINTPNKPVSGTVGALKVHIPAYKRVLLAGPPPVLEVMKEMVSYGRGLHGLSYREAVSVLQALASTKITAMFRCYRKRWRYSAARRLWNKHFLQYCRIHFAALNKLVQHNISIRKLCWRKIIAWKYYTKRAHQRRETFRIAFWPFYVWHRYANAMGKAKDKTTFLVGRVIPTLTTIKIFHAWKKYAKHEGVLNRKADGFYKQLFYADSRVLLRWLHEWSHQRHWIRRAWNTGGNGMSMRYVSRLVLNSFFIWRAYSSYRKHSREHIKTEFHKLRYILLKDKLPIRTVSNSQRRVAMKLAELKKRIKHRRATQDELKDKLKKRHRAKKDAQRKSSHAINSWDSTTSDDETASIGTIGGRDVGNPRRRSTRGGSINHAAVEIPLDFHDAVAALYQPNFTWKQNFTEIYDIDENHEENEGLTPLLLNSYQSAHISMIQNPDDFEFYHKMTKTNKQQTYIVQDSYTYNDHWNNFEASFRFHFYSYRVFKNLQYNAIKNKKVKLFMKIRKQRIKKQVMNELRHAIEVKTKRSLLVRGTEAEKLNQNVRTHQIEKIVRTRKLTNVVNSVLGRDHDDDLVDEETLRLNRIKQLNLIDIDDEEFIKNEKKRILEKQMELKRIQLEKERIFKPPNLLEIDREDREKEQKQAEDMVVFSKNTHLKTIDLVQASDTITENFRMKLNRTQDMVAEVLDSETAVTTRACTKQYEYMSAFKMHAAGALVNAMHRVYLEVQRSLMKEESKVYFRCLRLPMLLTRSKRMYFRKKLINWIRICKRLISISKKAPYYHNIRVKWVILNRWLKFISIVKLNPTPGIISFIQKKVFLLPDYNLTLERCGFEKSVYVDNNRLNQTITEFSSIFKRWKIFTQEEVLFRLLNTKIKLLYRFKILQYCFMAIKTGLNKSEYVKLLQNEITIFPIVRVLSDIEQIMKRFNAPRRKSLFTIMKKNNKKYIRYIIKDGQTSLSFKSFMTEFINNTNSRISTEQRMISDYFEIRGTQQFNDIKAPDRFHPIVPQIMQKVIGKEFFDPHEFSANGRSVTVPGGYKLTRIKFAYQYGLGIIGWQLFWTADGAMEIESPPRGSWSTASLGNNELVIPKDDFMSGLEYLYDSDVVVGVRIKLFFGGFTKWIGGKTSLSTLSVYMDCTNSCEREEYEDIRDSNLHPDEVTDPAYPYNFVIGLAGVITAGRATCLGLVIRKVVKQNLFSYSWVGDALWKAEMERTEANPLDTLPPIDLYSVPTHLSNFVPSHPVGTAVTANTAQPVDAGDSLTMSMLNSSAADSYSYDAQEGEGTEEEHNTNDDLISSVGSLHESDSQSSFPNSSTVADDDESIDSAAQNEENQEALPKPRQRRMGISNPVNNKPIAAPVKSTKEPLTSSEVQFFDVLRMRTTELSHARSRTAEFARNLWTNKNLRLDSVLCKLVVIRIVRGLSLWLFNALSKRLMPLSLSEKPALKLLRNAKVLISKADAVRNRVNMILNNANLLESSAQLWTGKHLLSPKERALKAAHHQQIAAMRAEAAKVKRDENLLRLQAVIDEKRGLAQMPKLTLSQYIVNNYRLKLAAARHKESLLERMTLEDVKTGLFGSNSKEKLLSREQMQAIHESLRGQQLKLKDVTSLERLIDGVVDEEGEIAEQQAQRTIELPRKSVRHRTDLAPMQSTVSNNRRKLSSLPPRPDGSKLNDTMALRLHNANLVNNRSRTPLVLTDRIGSPEFSSYLDQKPRGRAYSILEFNPAILPESSLTLTDSLNSPPVAEQRNKRRTSPNRRTQQARSRSVTSARSNTMMSSSHTKK